MESGIYYQILEVGVLYEKGGGRGKIWRLWERKRLRDEITFWMKILDCATGEQRGESCDEIIFEYLERLSKKYNLPHYKKLLEQREELLQCDIIYEMDKEEEYKLTQFIKRLLSDAQDCLYGYGNKERFYRILRVLHNLPRALHGRNAFHVDFKAISYWEAMSYAKGCMNKKMKEDYGEFYVGESE